jgi:hypothetical protein
LCFTGADPYSRLAAESSSALAEYFGVEVRVLNAEPDDRGRISRASRWADLLLMGRAGKRFMESLLARSFLNNLEDEVACPVLSFREYEEPVSLWQRILRGAGARGAENGT